MSHYYEDTIHPVTGKWTRALWADDYFGRHKYGVIFEGDPRVYRPHEVSLGKTYNERPVGTEPGYKPVDTRTKVSWPGREF